MNMRNKQSWLVVVAMMWMALAAQAVNYYWKTDIGSGDWSDAAKWNPAGVPGVVDTAFFSYVQNAPFTVTFTNDAIAKLSLGSTDFAQPVKVTFDLNGHTLTHTNGILSASRALEWTILNGTLWAHPTTLELNIGYYETNYVTKVLIGTNATYLHNGTYIIVGSRTAGELTVQDGGKLITQGSSVTDGLRMGNGTEVGYSNYTARMTVTGSGSIWSNLFGSITLSAHALARAELNVMDNGLLVHAGRSFMVANAPGANASLNILSGGVVDARLATNYMAIGYSGTGTVTVAGTGSMLRVPTNSLYFGNVANASQGTLIIENGGLVEKMSGNQYMYLGYNDNATGRLIVRDGGLLRWAGGQGSVYVAGVGTGAGSIGELTVTGATSRAILGEFVIGQKCGNALVTVTGGGTIEAFRTMYIGRIATNTTSSHNGLAKLVVTGTGSVLKKSALTITELPGASISTTISLGIGGCGFAGWKDSGMLYATVYGPNGKGLAIIENGGLVDINGTIAVYSNSTLRINGGRMQSGLIGLETNSVFQAVLRQGDANGTALMTATNATDSVRIWGATLKVERGTDFTPVAGDVYTLIAAGALNATNNRFTYAGAVLQDMDLITVGGTTFKVGYTAKAVTLTVRQTGTMLRIL